MLIGWDRGHAPGYDQNLENILKGYFAWTCYNSIHGEYCFSRAGLIALALLCKN